MHSNDVFPRLPETLLPWYQANKRDLPWRKDKNPYHVWISEVMLQQTRVEAVRGYYSRFLADLPSIDALANVDDDALYKLWEGLGYYSRARNLKKAAIMIMEHHGGVFPRLYRDVIALPGIGEYTAGAICSIAFGLPTPAVDGNVLRVAARLLNDDHPIDTPSFKKYISQQLACVYPECAGEFTQSLMELGATICGPNRKASCEFCPCNSFCGAYRNGTVDALPVRLPKREKKIEQLTVFILRCGDRFALEKRSNKGLLAGLWQLPNCPGRMSGQEALDQLEESGIKVREIEKIVERVHIFTHIKWEMHGVYVSVKETNEAFTWLTAEQLKSEAALPTAFRQFCDIREDD